MNVSQYQQIAHLEGLEFIKALLLLEEQRFERAQFLKSSTFEDINADFGIFPTMVSYPVYFAGDIREPKDKIIFMGINPGFSEEVNRKEQAFLQNHGSYEGYCRIFGDFFPREIKKGLLPYYANIAGFLRRYYNITKTIDWGWFQEHFITLDLIPYHSVSANGVRINDLKKYREVYFEIILKFLKYLNPQRPIFINGFPTCRSFLQGKDGRLLPEFRDVIEFTATSKVATGRINKYYDFIGLPFLNRPRGGVDAIVEAIRGVTALCRGNLGH
jgi:hypothetical protein